MDIHPHVSMFARLPACLMECIMLYLPTQQPYWHRFAGFDPGSHNLGAAIVDVNFVTSEVYVADTNTFVAEKYIQLHQRHDLMMYGDRQGRLLSVDEFVYDYLCEHQPDVIASEGPFLHMSVDAYATLIECVASIRNATRRFTNDIPLITYQPRNVKSAVNAKGTEKSDMYDAVLAYPNISFAPHVHYTKLTEHSIDAIAVCITAALEWGFKPKP
jgi:Holliday junction resolvasome RuvABC endonuclease subunit